MPSRESAGACLLELSQSRGETRFPRNPFFPYFEAMRLLTDDRAPTRTLWKIEPLVEKARRLAEAMPTDDAVRKLLGDLDKVQQRLAMPAPVAEMFEQLFGMFDED